MQLLMAVTHNNTNNIILIIYWEIYYKLILINKFVKKSLMAVNYHLSAIMQCNYRWQLHMMAWHHGGSGSCLTSFIFMSCSDWKKIPSTAVREAGDSWVSWGSNWGLETPWTITILSYWGGGRGLNLSPNMPRDVRLSGQRLYFFPLGVALIYKYAFILMLINAFIYLFLSSHCDLSMTRGFIKSSGKVLIHTYLVNDRKFLHLLIVNF